MKVSIVVGNPKPRSRTRTVSERLVQKLVRAPFQLEVIDLADHAYAVFDPASEKMEQITASVAPSDLVVAASPTYKATYTGLLKAFFDRYGANGLVGVTAIPVMTGTDRTHALGPDIHLVPLLLELGATVPDRGLYFVMSSFDDLDRIAEKAAERIAGRIARLAGLATQLKVDAR